MERTKNIINRTNIVVLYYFITLGGAIGFKIEAIHQFFLLVTPLYLLTSAALFIYLNYRPEGGRIPIKYMAVIYLFTFICEVVGVYTGKVFGAYEYGDVLGYKLFEVPLLIGLNWVVLLLSAISLLSYLSKDRRVILLGASIMMVLFDIIMEPAAIKIGMWSWDGVAVPIQNYVAWFLISILSSLIILMTNSRKSSAGIEYHILIAQTLFFITVLI